MQKNYCYDYSTHTKVLSGPEKQRNPLPAIGYDSIEAQCSFWYFNGCINICMPSWTFQIFHLHPHWTVMMYVLNKGHLSLEICRPARFPVRSWPAQNWILDLQSCWQELQRKSGKTLTASHIICNGKLHQKTTISQHV